MNDPIFLAVSFGAFFVALTIHEFSHGFVAYLLGDDTAMSQGRLTFNPIAHIDIFGTILLPLLLILSGTGIVFGWAKPVPVNFYRLRYGKWGVALVSIAGPAANFIGGAVSIIALRLYTTYAMVGLENLLVTFLFSLIIVNFVLMVFNLIPIPPLDGSKILFAVLPSSLDNVKIFLERYGIFLLLILITVGSGFLNFLFNIIFVMISYFL